MVESSAWIPFTFPINMTGQPAASVPAGWTGNNLPVGLQMIGRHLADETVLRASAAFVSSRTLGGPMASDHFADRFVVRFRWGAIWALPRPFNAFWCLASVPGLVARSSRARSASSHGCHGQWSSTAPCQLGRDSSQRAPDSAVHRCLAGQSPHPLHAVSPTGLPSPAGRGPPKGPRRRGRGGPRPHRAPSAAPRESAHGRQTRPVP